MSDKELIASLYAKASAKKTYSKVGLTFRNAELSGLTQKAYTAPELSSLETFLTKKETLTIPTVKGYHVYLDGAQRPVSIVAATDIEKGTPHHGDMSSMLYLRDHIQAAGVLMELYLTDPTRYRQEGEEGKVLLLSALHLMSTPAQLERFKTIIKKGKGTQEEWPHISLLFDDLEGKEQNDWRNKQDTFQMLAYLTCDALERGYVHPDTLSESHKKFLGSVAPLLKAVGFPNYENSGSWEEIAAVRTSVMAIETALLHKIVTLAEDTELAFLAGGLEVKEIASMRNEGLKEIGRRLPFESPDYPKSSIKYREADVALTYVLLYGIPKLLEQTGVPVGPKKEVMNERAIEELVLQELAALIDPTTGGMRRYAGDSYQRVNFHTNEIQKGIRDIKQTVQKEAMVAGGEIDLDKKQTLRGELVPKGKEAAWTHPLGQLSAWAAKRSLELQKSGNQSGAMHYRALSTRFLNQMLATVTGENEWQAVLDSNKQYILQKAPAARLPECYVAYQTDDGRMFVVPSPHTPLNWSSAMLKEAVGLLRAATVLQ